MGGILILAGPRPDPETVALLSRLLADAQAGKVIGIAYVALHSQDEYSGDVVGQCLRSPLLSRGICRCLEDTIARK